VAEPEERRARDDPAAPRFLPALAIVLVLLTALGVVMRLPAVVDRLTGAVEATPSTLLQSSATATDPGRSTLPTNPSFDDGTRALLARMTEAVRRHDVGEFSAAAGNSPMHAQLRRILTGLAALPLATFSFAIDHRRPSVAVPGEGAGARTLPVLVTYRLQGWDEVPLTVPMLLVVAPVGGSWAVVGDRTTTDTRTGQRLEPWLLGDLYLTRTRHVLVIGDRAHAAQVRRLARTLEGLATDVRRVWPEPTWNGTVVAYAMTSTAFVRSWYGRSAVGDSGNGDRAAFVAKVVTLPSSGRGPGAVRMVLTPYLLDRPTSGSVDVLRHEMTHVATARLSTRIPTWLVEGAAEYTGFARRAGDGRLDATTTFGSHGLTATEVSSTARGRWRPTLLAGSDFYRGSESAVDEHYNGAFITCLFIADRYGEAALRRLYEASARTTEAAALSQVLHTTHARLVTAVGAYATTLRSRLVFR
jgi:hypothetical protein